MRVFCPSPLKLYVAFVAFVFCSFAIFAPCAEAQSPKPKTIDSIQFEVFEPMVGIASTWTKAFLPANRQIVSDNFDATWRAFGDVGEMSVAAKAQKGALTLTLNCDVDTAKLDSSVRQGGGFGDNGYIGNLGTLNLYLPYSVVQPKVNITVSFDISTEAHSRITNPGTNRSNTFASASSSVWGIDSGIAIVEYRSKENGGKPNQATEAHKTRTFRHKTSVNLVSVSGSTSGPSDLKLLNHVIITDTNGEKKDVYSCNLYDVLRQISKLDKARIVSDPPQRDYFLTNSKVVGYNFGISKEDCDANASASGTVTFDVEYEKPNVKNNDIAQVGDVIVYRINGAITHSGVVRRVTNDKVSLVESKWGATGRYLHNPNIVPSKYGKNWEVYHTRRGSNLLQKRSLGFLQTDKGNLVTYYIGPTNAIDLFLFRSSEWMKLHFDSEKEEAKYWNQDLRPDSSRVKTGNATASYNCHGYTFTDGKWWIGYENYVPVEAILRDNGYVRVASSSDR